MVNDFVNKDLNVNGNLISGDFSVLLSVYCKELPLYLKLALESIWDIQTLRPSQIIIVKDGPLTPELDNEIKFWENKLGSKLTIVTLIENVGLAAALNHGLNYCKFDLVARMDTDDIATEDRFKLQVDFMHLNTDISASSGYIEEWNKDFTMQLSSRPLPLKHIDIENFAKTRSPISHPACIFRKSDILAVGGYPNIYPEDHLLWVKLIQSGRKLANIPNVILKMRTGDDFITRRGFHFLKGELTSYSLMYQSGFLSFFQFLKVSILRSLVRLSPDFVKILLYKWLR